MAICIPMISNHTIKSNPKYLGTLGLGRIVARKGLDDSELPLFRKGVIVGLVALFGILLMPSPAHAFTLAKAPNNLGLVGYWPLNEGTGLKATDFSGVGTTGDVKNGAVWTDGKLGPALRFDGSNDCVSMGDVELVTSNKLSMSLWAKFTASQAGYNIIAGKVLNSLNYSIYIDSIQNTKVRFVIDQWNNGGLSNTAMNDGRWHHYVGVYNGATTKLYVDGILQTTTGATTGNIPNTGDGLTIGGASTNCGQPFAGSVDEVRLYNRALGGNDVTKLYAAGLGKIESAQSEKASGLVGHWKFDDRRGLGAVDWSGNANTGTLSGGALWDQGKLGGAVSLDGTDDKVLTPSTTVGKFGTGDFTISFWIKTTDTVNGTIIAQDAGGNGAWLLLIQTNICYWQTNPGVTNLIATSCAAITDGRWHQVVVKRTGTTTDIFLDNVSQLPTTDTKNYNVTSAITMGSGATYGAHQMFLDDVRIYNKALSTAEMAALYTAGTTRPATVNASAVKLTAGTSLATGLVGHWTFDGNNTTGSGGTGTARDSSTSNINGTLTNMSTTTPARVQGRLGQALNFDGVNDYVTFGTGQSFASTDSHTYAAWVKPISYPGTYNGIIAYNTSGTGGGLYVYTSGNVAAALVKGGNVLFSGVRAISLNTWTHLVFAYNGTSNVGKLYVNGVLDATSGALGAWSGSETSPRNIGAYAGGAAYWWNGAIDDARVYNRELSAAEVKLLYNLAR